MSSANDYVLSELKKLRDEIARLKAQDSSPVVAHYVKNANQTIGSGAGSFINFQQKDYDTRNAVIQTPNTRFVAPVAGYYNVSAWYTCGTSAAWGAGEWMSIVGYINGAVDHTIALVYPGIANSAPAPGGSHVFHLNKGDYLELLAEQNSGANQVIYGTNPTDRWCGSMDVHLIRGY